MRAKNDEASGLMRSRIKDFFFATMYLFCERCADKISRLGGGRGGKRIGIFTSEKRKINTCNSDARVRGSLLIANLNVCTKGKVFEQKSCSSGSNGRKKKQQLPM